MNYHCKSLNLKSVTLIFMLLFESLLTAQSQKPINVIFMIGDGMGVSQVTSAFYFERENQIFRTSNL